MEGTLDVTQAIAHPPDKETETQVRRQVSATSPPLQSLLSEAAQRHRPLGVSTPSDRALQPPRVTGRGWGGVLAADDPHVSSPLSGGCPTQLCHLSLEDFLGKEIWS